MTATVHLSDVSKQLGGEPVLRGVTLEAEPGSVTALLGRNGSGKSTLLRLIAGLDGRDGGDARVLGFDPERLPLSARERLAFVTDAFALNAGPRGRDELRLHRAVRGARWDEAYCMKLLGDFAIDTSKPLGALSKGQGARLRLILALAARPDLLLLDEPAAGLDLFARRDFLEAIIDAVQHEERAVFIASHLIDDVERIADRLVFLRDGAVIAAGAIDDLRDRYRRARVRLGPGGAAALGEAARGLLGVTRIEAEPHGPPDEQVVHFHAYADDLLRTLEERADVRRVEVRRLSLRDLFFEVLGGETTPAAQPREEVQS